MPPIPSSHIIHYAQYRLARADGPLTEAEFQKMPLEFTGQQTFRWGGPAGKTFNFTGTYVREDTVPKGSTWVRNPVPRNDKCRGGGAGTAPW